MPDPELQGEQQSSDFVTDSSNQLRGAADWTTKEGLSKKLDKAESTVEKEVSEQKSEVEDVSTRLKGMKPPPPPALEKAPKLEPPPKMTAGEMSTFAGVMTGLALVFGAVSSMAALTAVAGALKGYAAGDIEKARERRADYQTNMDAVRERNTAILGEYKAASEKYKDDLNGLRTEMEMIGYRHNVPIVNAQAQKGDVLAMMKGLQALELAHLKAQEADKHFNRLMDDREQAHADQQKSRDAALNFHKEQSTLMGGNTQAQRSRAIEVQTGWQFWVDRFSKEPGRLKKDIAQTGGLLNDPQYHAQYTNAQKVYPGETQEQHEARVEWLDRVAHTRADEALPQPPAMNFRGGQQAGPRSAPQGTPQAPASPPGGNAYSQTATPPPAGATHQGAILEQNAAGERRLNFSNTKLTTPDGRPLGTMPAIAHDTLVKGPDGRLLILSIHADGKYELLPAE